MRGFEKTYLRGLAQKLSPVVFVGKDGVSVTLLQALEKALTDHELVKVRFTHFKEEKRELAPLLAEKTGAELVGLIGHHALLYRFSKGKIRFPVRESA